MSEEELIENAAPTLAGIKTGSLFTCRFDSQEQTRKDLRKLNALLLPKGLRIIPLRMVRGRILIYVYRISRLGEDLAKQEAREILKQRGYNASSIESCLAVLFKKLREEEDFPHEIGLFLGYPPIDVRGFMEHRDTGLKCTGFWKVYGDEVEARKQFEKYRRCTEAYEKIFSCGRSVEGLIVAG